MDILSIKITIVIQPDLYIREYTVTPETWKSEFEVEVLFSLWRKRNLNRHECLCHLQQLRGRNPNKEFDELYIKFDSTRLKIEN